MTQEQKEILFKDLCARLPYGVKIEYNGKIYSLSRPYPNFMHIINGEGEEMPSINKCKPYLRSMSSMTDEELKEYDEATDLDVADSHETLKANLNAKSRVRISKWYHGNDYLNAHHFDYRGLIPMGLVLEAPEDMYNKKEC